MREAPAPEATEAASLSENPRARPGAAGQGRPQPTCPAHRPRHSHPESHGHPSGSRTCPPAALRRSARSSCVCLHPSPQGREPPSPPTRRRPGTNHRAPWRHPEAVLICTPRGENEHRGASPSRPRSGEGGCHPPAGTGISTSPATGRAGTCGRRRRSPRLRRGFPALPRPERAPHSGPPTSPRPRRTRGAEILTSGSLVVLVEHCARVLEKPHKIRNKVPPPRGGIQ